MGQRPAIALALVLLVGAVFHPVRHHAFVDYDDVPVVLENPHVVGGLRGENLLGAFREPYYANWTPLAWVSLQIDRSLYGTEPAGYLLTNVAQHAAASVLLFLALACMTGATLPSAFVAAVFAVHPLHVESVAWASERRDTLSGLFWMATLLAHAGYAARPSPRRYAGVALLFALGLLSKATLVTLPLCLLLLDRWPLGRLRRGHWRRALLEKLPLLVLSAGAGAMALAAQRGSGGMRESALPLSLRVENAIASYGLYLRDAFWPSGLSPFHPFPFDGVDAVALAGGALALLGIGAVSLVTLRSRPFVFVGFAWFLVTLAPMIGLVPIGSQARADRYTYVPLVGVAIVVAFGAHALAERRRAWAKPLAGAGALAIAVLAVVASQQVGVWRDTVTLFQHALRVDADNYFAHHRLGTAYRARGDHARADHHYREAIRIEPRYLSPKLELASSLRLRRRGEEALPLFREALALRPDDALARRAYGMTLLELGRYAEAKPQLTLALRHGEEQASLHAALGIACLALGERDSAIRHSREALRRDPGQLSAANNLAWILATDADPARRAPVEAVRIAEVAVAAGEERPDLLDTLAAAYAASGRFDEAVQAAERAIAGYASAGLHDRAAESRERLALFRAGRPFVEPLPR